MKSKKAFYAKEIAKIIGNGCTGIMVGRLANELNIKTTKYGIWVQDAVTKYGRTRHYSTFKYYRNAIKILKKAFLERKGLEIS
ncbi:hypothetical protein [Ureibacillus acetophenoni]|uniref:Uncharacterized protein n=1 Tax=Ureibacillus acetophenoni TaxID=614649 RepID=A0A285UHT7_9BACL|nr:hypothetical protein [Ureibacillus acetophenoni]SOC41450.1 hypothetical protein SAMN05877842_11061 [Ureibacillus acetophenoni]